MDDKKINVNIDSTNLKDVLVYCKPKETLVLVRKFGLNWDKEIPLQQIWKEYNLTRERIRQIETQALMRFRRLIVWNVTYMNVLDEAKKIIKTHWHVLREDLLISKLINKKLFKFSKQELKLILVSDFNVSYLKRNKYIRKSFYLSPLYEDILVHMSVFVFDYFNETKKSEDLYDFIWIVKEKFTNEYKDISPLKNDLFYMNFFDTIKSIKVFDWKVWLLEFADINPKTVKLKILYSMRRQKKPVHYQELPSLILKYFPEKPIKLNTAHNELVKNNDVFVNLWLWLYWLKERWYEWWQVKNILIRIFERTWRKMTVKELCKEMLKEKMVSPNTIMLNLQKYKELFQRIDKWVYVLTPWYKKHIEATTKKRKKKNIKK